MLRWIAAIALAFAVSLPAQWAGAALNLNTATKDELIALPGIGPAKAQAIVDYRKLNGPFKTVDDLKNVKGIGAKRLDKLRAELTVGPAQAKVAAATPAKAEPRSASAPAAAAAKGEVRAAEVKPAPK